MGKSLHPRWSDLFHGPESDWYSTDWFTADRCEFPDHAPSHRSPGVSSAATLDDPAPAGAGFVPSEPAGSPPGIIAVDLVHEIEMPEMPSMDAALTQTGTAGANTLIGTSNKDTLSGLGGNDTLKGKGGDDVLDGGDDRDKLIGGNGDDLLTGGSGKDTLTGNKGDDTLIGGTGDDVYRGQYGKDVFVMDEDGGNDTIRDFNVSQGDRIDVSALDITGFSQLDITELSSSKVKIDFGDGSVTLTDLTGSLGSQSFIFANVGPPPVAPPGSGTKGDFDITVVYSGSWTASLKSAFSDAVDRFESIIWGDLPSTTVPVGGNWMTVDDVAIAASLVDIDGLYGILGQAGPTSVRSSSFLPSAGLMQFDVADATWLNNQGSWDQVIEHEMAHVLGFGTLWPYKGLLTDASTSNPRYVGTEGMREYGELLGTGSPTTVPVEQDGEAGTRLGHWDEQTFGSELMTGYLGGSNQFSDMSAAAFADLGYDLAPEANWLTDEYALFA